MITKILLAVTLATTNSMGCCLINEALAPGGDNSTNGVVYDDPNDTTSFVNCGTITERGEYAEVYGERDVYDYISYTAAYSRTFYLCSEATDNAVMRIDVYRPSISVSDIAMTYDSATNSCLANTLFVNKGETIYFRISCTSCCWWRVYLDVDENLSGTSYVEYTHFNGYSMPHSGPATIYYKKDSSCNQYVSGQNFTFSSMIDEAIDVWESVGLVQFVESETQALFTITISSETTGYSVSHRQKLLLPRHYCSAMSFTTNLDYYEYIIDGWTFYGEDATIYQGVKGVMVKAFAIALGLQTRSTQSYYYNVTFAETKPYGRLGDGDLNSFYALWGDPLDYVPSGE